MKIFDTAKHNFERGTWTEQHLDALVKKGWLTQAEKEEICERDE